TYDPFWIQQNTGLSAYNLGTALQQPDTSFFLLKEVLKTQKPKYILYDIYFKVMQEGFGAEQATTVLKEMKPSKNAWSFYLKNLDFDTKLSYYNTWISPFGRLQSILANSGGRQSEPRTPFYIGRGFYSTTGIVDAALLTDEKHPFSNEYKPFDPRQVEYVKALCALARENGIEVRFVSAPIPPTIYDYISYNDEITRDTKALAESVDVTFRDFNADVKSGALPLVDTDFADQGHLNQAGNKKFCDFLLTVIKK
ncbi:MAG: SGNH/GDSL hydrolase family protein, partial [Clostridia bacterium]